ncbi:Thioredoxin [Bacillus cereus 95/8201]|uniref:thioredoxin family protein n=1 Tax=Bacillus cereus group TaxID=86661 RepID=UPI0001A08E9A|nr:thioredoxin family protein [Bacillus cereus]AJH60222.1 thioredoxin family protein [Bacillus cereus]AJK37513.1 thioredoxin family protein [Bacillus cereus]EEL13889.1 Thioredoxin [Bacillus cereus 95/8201]QKH69364.1 thioredoxin family protein [Bacillus cereus]QKH71461.1 thioredoxin family protein [Bacillus cereus]
MLKEINLTELEQQIMAISKPIVLKFTAEWCPGCRQLAPIVESISEQLGDKIVFFDVNVDKEIELAQKFDVMSIPTLVLLKNGKEVDRVTAPAPNEDAVTSFIQQ